MRGLIGLQQPTASTTETHLQAIHHAIGIVPVYLWAHVDNQLAGSPVLKRNLRLLTDLGLHVLETAVCEGGCE